MAARAIDASTERPPRPLSKTPIMRPVSGVRSIRSAFCGYRQLPDQEMWHPSSAIVRSMVFPGGIIFCCKPLAAGFQGKASWRPFYSRLEESRDYFAVGAEIVAKTLSGWEKIHGHRIAGPMCWRLTYQSAFRTGSNSKPATEAQRYRGLEEKDGHAQVIPSDSHVRHFRHSRFFLNQAPPRLGFPQPGDAPRAATTTTSTRYPGLASWAATQARTGALPAGTQSCQTAFMAS